MQIKPRGSHTAGLVWRYQNETNYFLLRVNVTSGLLSAERVRNGRRTTIPALRAAPISLVPWDWAEVRVSFEGSTMTAFVNGVKALEAKDSIPGWTGRVGLWSAGPGITDFDDFRLNVTR